ncbi:MAG: hypothetical protein GY928_14365, partial [Colwellia sp.]|nr:hypothetical protein [Colwellia sp.]
ALGIKQKATASNVANINNEDYKPLYVRTEDVQNAGVKAHVTRANESYRVDLSKKIVQMLVTKHSFKANIETIKAEDEIISAIIDLSA